jgi:hypothetical protein
VHVTETVLECTNTCFVDVRLIAYTKWIFLRSQGLASRCHFQASGRSLDCGLVLFFSNQSKSVRVVVSKLGEMNHLRIDIDTWVNESNSIDMKFNSRSSKASSSDLVVLLLKVVGVDCVVMSSVRLAPNAKLVVLGLVLWESASLSTEVPT